VLVVTLVIGVYWFLSSSKPQYNGEIQLEGLSKEVHVYFDNFGIPHIYASNEQDAYYALGYLHAQERLFQMELLRRIGGGRLSEVFGEDLLETDKFLRTIGFNEIAKQSARAYLADTTQAFQQAAFAYLGGVNSFIKNGPTPPEFSLLGIQKQEFTAEDIYRAVGYMGFSFNTALRTDPLLSLIGNRLGPEYLHDLVINSVKENTTIPTHSIDSSDSFDPILSALRAVQSLPLPIWKASNSWVVGPSRSKSGKPILANDAHIGFSQPSVWYEAHLSYPGFEFYGNHLAGVPFGLVGHNDFSAWGLTIFPNDDMDFYRETSNPNKVDEYWQQDHWEKYQVRNEKIFVKGADDVEFQVKSTGHGPVLNQVNQTIDSLESQPVSFYWTFNKFPSKALQTAYGMAHSKSIQEFEQAISLLEAPGLNFTYADKEGNIAWWAVARLLRRPEHVEPKLILDGATGQDDPIGFFPFSHNPKSVNPRSGFVYSANNQPDSADGHWHSGYYFPGARGQRIIQLLSSKSDWDLESFKSMILDDQSPVYPALCSKILNLLPPDLNPMEQQAATILRQWDGTHQLTDKGPTIYYPLVNQILQNTFRDELGAEQSRVFGTTMVARRSLPFLIDNDTSVWWDNVQTETLENREEIISSSFKQTIAYLSEKLGADPNQWKWENVHILEHVHPVGRQKPFDKLFNVGPFPVTGGDEVINKMDFSKSAIPYRVTSGASMRILIDLADMENSQSIIPTGQSGHLLSPHYQDQAELYVKGEFRPQHRSKDKILAESKQLLVLKPLKTN